jgi:hypothetical protein
VFQLIVPLNPSANQISAVPANGTEMVKVLRVLGHFSIWVGRKLAANVVRFPSGQKTRPG